MAEKDKPVASGAGLPEMPDEIVLSPEKAPLDWKRLLFMTIGIVLFAIVGFVVHSSN